MRFPADSYHAVRAVSQSTLYLHHFHTANNCRKFERAEYNISITPSLGPEDDVKSDFQNICEYT